MISKQSFSELIENVGNNGDAASIKLLEELVHKYPFFHSAQVLLAKVSKQNGHVLSNKHIRTASAYSQDRVLLYHLVENPSAKPQSIIQDKQPELTIDHTTPALSAPNQEQMLPPSATEIARATDVPTDQELLRIPEDVSSTASTEALSPAILAIAAYKAEVSHHKKLSEDDTTLPQSKHQEQPSGEMLANAPLEVAIDESVSYAKDASPKHKKSDAKKISKFSAQIPSTDKRKVYVHGKTATPEWIQVENVLNFIAPSTPVQPSNKRASQKNSNPVPEPAPMAVNQQEIINKFINASEDLEKITIKDNVSAEDLSKHSTSFEEAAVSETLANLFVKQGKKKLAIQAFKKLSLLYPDKKAYFATRIQEIKNS